MKKPRSFSPIDVLEQVLFEKLGNTKVRVWQYVALLAVLFILPMFIPYSALDSAAFLTVYYVVAAVSWMGSRLVGRQLSKTTRVDSVLIYRFFAGVSWILPTAIGWLAFVLNRVSNPTERQLFQFLLIIATLVSLVHIVGIIIHLRGNAKHIRNVSKEDLFQ